MGALDDLRLDGKVALVTGAASERGIGRAIARRLAAAGAQLVVGDLDEAGGPRPPASAPRTVRQAWRCGWTSPMRPISAAFKQAVERFGRVDILVNNAGISSPTRAWDLTVEEFDRMMAINLRGGFLCARAAMPLMMQQRWGRLIWLASVAAKIGGGLFGTSHYAASKAGVIGLCQGLARELAPFGITSNAIAPGFVDTDIAARTMDREQFREFYESGSGAHSDRPLGSDARHRPSSALPGIRGRRATLPARSWT